MGLGPQRKDSKTFGTTVYGLTHPSKYISTDLAVYYTDDAHIAKITTKKDPAHFTTHSVSLYNDEIHKRICPFSLANIILEIRSDHLT